MTHQRHWSAFVGRRRSHHRVALIAAGVLAAIALPSCGDGGSPVLDQLVELHSSAPATDGANEEIAAPVDLDAESAFCAAGRDLDAIHVGFHEGGDEYPSADVVDQAVAAAIIIAGAGTDELLVERQRLAQALMQARDDKTMAVFKEPKPMNAAIAVFDHLERTCTGE